MSIPYSEVKLASPLPHPGRLLALDYMAPLDLAPYTLAKLMGVARQRIERLVRGEQALTADTAARLARVFPNTTAEFWMRLQAAHDLSKIEIEQRDELAMIAAYKVA